MAVDAVGVSVVNQAVQCSAAARCAEDGARSGSSFLVTDSIARTLEPISDKGGDEGVIQSSQKMTSELLDRQESGS